MSNLLSINVQCHVVVSILVSVYSHKHKADYTTVHNTYNMLHTTNKKSQMASFSQLVINIIIVILQHVLHSYHTQ